METRKYFLDWLRVSAFASPRAPRFWFWRAPVLTEGMYISRSSNVFCRLACSSALSVSMWPALSLAQAPSSPPPARQQSRGGPEQKPAANAVSGITVQAQQAPVRTAIDRRSYSVATDLAAASGGSLADALRNIPGASVDLNGNLTIRGGAVQIMIDGQPSQIFNGPAAAQALQSMPADRIDRVEVINNPSAAYSPEGQAGIINLVTKKSAPAGLSGSLRANSGTSGHDNVGANFVYQKGKLGVLADGSWEVNRQKLRSTSTGTVLDPVTRQNDPRTQTEIVNPPNEGWTTHGAFSYQLDPKTQLTGELRYQAAERGRYDNYTLLTTDPSGAPLSAYIRNGFLNLTQTFSSEQLTWRRQFPGDGHNLVLFYNHSLYQVRSEKPSSNLTTAPAPPSFFYNDQLTKRAVDTHEFKIDYTRPMAKMDQLKAGYDLRNTDADVSNDALFGTGPANATINPIYTSLFHYHQMINAAYVSYEHRIGKLTVLSGLRVEDEHLKLDQLTQSVQVDRDNAGVFPSLHLGYSQNSNVTWVANYSLRIQRPNPQQFDPYRNLSDPYNIQAGNPNLKSEQTHSFEGGWQYRKGSTAYLATLYYRQSEHIITPVVTRLGNGVLLTTFENGPSAQISGLELVAAAPLSKTLSYNVSADLSYIKLETPVLGVTQIHEGFNVGGRASLNWQPTKNDLIQIIGIINPGRLSAQSTTDPLLILGAGYRHKLTNTLAFLLQTQDPFGAVRQYTRLTSPGLNQNTVVRAHLQTFMIGFTWGFGGRPQRDQGFDVGTGGLGE